VKKSSILLAGLIAIIAITEGCSGLKALFTKTPKKTTVEIDLQGNSKTNTP
jgi:hypothetical protein